MYHPTALSNPSSVVNRARYPNLSSILLMQNIRSIVISLTTLVVSSGSLFLHVNAHKSHSDKKAKIITSHSGIALMSPFWTG